MRLLPKFVAPAFMIALAALPMLGGLSGCSSNPSSKFTVIPQDELPDLNRAGLSRLWERQINLSPGERIRRVWRVGESVYVTTTDARLVRIDAANGRIVWQQGLGAENLNIYKPIELKAAEGSTARDVLVVTGGEVFRFDFETGDETRTPARLGLSVSADPVVVGETLCVAGAGSFYGLYVDRPDLRRWVLPQRGDVFISTPVAFGGDVMVASRRGQLWRINAEVGDWEWKDRKVNGFVVAGLNADANALYVPSLDQRLYAFSTPNGGQLWETQLEGRLEDTPVLAGPVVIVKSQSSGFYGLARTNGAIKWHAPDVAQVGNGDDNSIWALDSGGTLKSLNLNDGTVLASAPANAVQWVVPNPVDGNVVLVTYGGRVGTFSTGRSRSSEVTISELPATSAPATAPAP
jgi:hypothetical protein